MDRFLHASTKVLDASIPLRTRTFSIVHAIGGDFKYFSCRRVLGVPLCRACSGHWNFASRSPIIVTLRAANEGATIDSALHPLLLCIATHAASAYSREGRPRGPRFQLLRSERSFRRLV